MTNQSLLRLFRPTPTRAATLALILALGGCTSTGEGLFASDRVDYRAAAQRTQPLDVPPDLTQLTRDSRYLPQGGVVSASDLGKPGAAPLPNQVRGGPDVAIRSAGELRVERLGNQRWIVSKQSPEELWPLVKKFWLEHGFTIAEESAVAGTLETGWAENRVHLPNSFIRDTLGKIVDGLFDSGLRDRYRTRLERGANGTEIYITHFGAKEEITGFQKDGTQWVPRDSDPGLEAEMTTLMMVTLGGGGSDAARQAVAAAPVVAVGASGAVAAAPAMPAGSVHAHPVAGTAAATLQVDDSFDRAWRRVGLALDHSGFTVEDRDRAQGTYFVRFTNAKEAAKEEPGFFSRLWNWGTKPTYAPTAKYRVLVKSNAEGATVAVMNDKGEPDNSENAQNIVALLVGELK